MNRTRPSVLAAAVLTTGVLAFFLSAGIVSAGGSVFVPPATLPVTLALVGGVLLWLAVPIHRAVHGTSARRMNPLQAARVVVLAKASALVGAAATGLSGGLTLFLVTRPVIGSAATVWLALANAAGALVLVAAALIAEWCCVIPPDDRGGDAARRPTNPDAGPDAGSGPGPDMGRSVASDDRSHRLTTRDGPDNRD